jgi:bacillithiol biosynthesis cysteine-adding enzyme BshC
MELEMSAPLESTRRLNAAGKQLESLGYPPQVIKGESECNFFLEISGRRRKITWTGDRFHLPGEGRYFDKEELIALLQSSPDRFSPNVALRPVVQQTLFPATAYVAGPGEIAYWAQLKPVFDFFGRTMPAVYPRADAVMTSLKLNKIRYKLGLELADLLEPMDTLEERSLRRIQQHPALATLERHRTQLLEQMALLRGELESTTRKPEPWQEMLPNLTEQLQQILDRLERAILHNDEAQVEATRRQLIRLCTALAPSRKPQDRVYTVFSWVFAYGWELIPRLLREITLDYDKVQEVEL